MKKVFKKINIFSFILGALIFGSVSLVSAYTLFANTTSFRSNDTNWNVNNVQSAIDDLYLKCNKKLTFTKYDFSDSYGISIASRPTSVTIDEGIYIVLVEHNRSWNGPSVSIERNITNNYTNLSCTNDCIIKNVSNLFYYNRGSQSIASNSYVKYWLADSIYFVKTYDDNTVLTTTYNTDPSQVAPSNVTLTALKITTWTNT